MEGEVFLFFFQLTINNKALHRLQQKRRLREGRKQFVIDRLL